LAFAKEMMILALTNSWFFGTLGLTEEEEAFGSCLSSPAA